jgi:MerR family redox-sensitive transcriptional activator SoxR
LNISEVAREVGLRSSAIRYYEKIGLLPPAERKGKQRRYDTTALYRLAIIQRARQLGFTLDEIRQLFFGFSSATRASTRWQQLSRQKLAEFDNLMDSVKAVQWLLKKMQQNCNCETLDQCGKGIFRSADGNLMVRSLGAESSAASSRTPFDDVHKKTYCDFDQVSSAGRRIPCAMPTFH